MKILPLLVLAIFLFVSRPSPNDINFSGKWHSETQTSSFDLNLKQLKREITGRHCSVQNAGQKIDCVLNDSEISITGIVSDSATILVLFKSQISLKKGRARIRMINESEIEWRIVSNPDGLFNLPDRAILFKQ